jgi:thiol-disulfide isomerase/thioredoxin
MAALSSVWWLLVLLTVGVPSQSTEQWFPTGVPELTSDEGLIALMTWSDYSELAKSLTGPRQVVLVERPPLSERARFGVNFVLGGRNRALAVDGSDEAGYRFYGDTNADGRLTADEMLPMPKVDGKFTVRFQSTVSETLNGVTETYPVDMTFTMDTAIPPGQTERIPVLRRRSTTVRRGTVQLAGARVAFALLGHAGIYDQPSSEVVFDLRGRGIDLADDRSPDRFLVRDGKVTIAGVTYAFRVDRYGRGLALSATDTPMPPRPTLAVGSAAPDFGFVDLDGRRHRLSEFRGQVVLLDFWAVWCGPCRAEAPVIGEVFARFKSQGFMVIGINPNDPPADIRRFLDQYHVGGLTTREPFEGPAHTLFRVTAWPAHFLIGRDGRILANDIDAAHVSDAVAAAIRSRLALLSLVHG